MLKESLNETRREVRRRAHALREFAGPPRGVEEHLEAHSGDVRLNLGCGGALLDGWLNTDRDPAPGAVHLDVTRRFPLPDASVDRILCEHVIEHVSLDDAHAMLAECERVARPGARIRVSTPDLAFVVDLGRPSADDEASDYLAWAREAFASGRRGSARALVVNNAMRNWGHRFLFDEETLAVALTDAGFGDVRRHRYGESDDRSFDGVEGCGLDGTGRRMRRIETLALEATR